MNVGCPRCGKPLEEAQVNAVNVRVCRDCAGALLPHSDLTGILEASWRAVGPEAAEKLEFHTPSCWQNEAARYCPDCTQPMEKYGYMGVGAIQIDRCDACALVWVDANELQNMVLALAKANYRIEKASRLEHDRDFPLLAAPATKSEGEDWLSGDGDAPFVVAQILLALLRRR